MILENLETMRSPMFIRFVWGAGIATPYTQVHIHIDTHTPAYICTIQSNNGTGTSRRHMHQSGTQSSTNTPSGPCFTALQAHCYPHITAGHHRIRVGPSPP